MKVLKWRYVEPPKFSSVPEKPGVYIISTRQESDHQYEVKYIGQTANLHVRAKEHWSKKEPNKELSEHIEKHYIMKFNYALVDSTTDRNGMLSYMLDIFQPQFNRSSFRPDAPIVKCTVPGVRKYQP
jgi:excinuclease UvrABC nuclease subunit